MRAKLVLGLIYLKNILLAELNLDWLIDTYNKAPNKEKFFNEFFNNLAGTDVLKSK